ncbi:MAG: DMT family transporter [Thermoflavifilum sp.]|nr:DMT family transporter [Thermoflavifilum sp.]MCL6514079.1 DMT family transporter [Alicyclobacillus sp.]
MLLVVATLLWSGNYLCGRYLAPSMPATLLNTVRWLLSSLELWILLAVRGQRLPVLRLWWPFAPLGFVGIFAFSTLTYLGLGHLPAAVAGMISAFIPVAILIFTPLLLRTRVRARAWIGALLSVAGVLILMAARHGGAGASWWGELEMILAALAWGLYTVMGRRFAHVADSLTLTAGAAVYGTLFSALSCIGTVDIRSIHVSIPVLLAVLYVSTLASVGAYLAWNVGVQRVGPELAAPYINLLPVWTVLLGVAWMHEHVAGAAWVGGLLTIIGAVLASL